MSEKKIIKCAICDRVAEGEECQLMTVITNEKGKSRSAVLIWQNKKSNNS